MRVRMRLGMRNVDVVFHFNNFGFETQFVANDTTSQLLNGRKLIGNGSKMHNLKSHQLFIETLIVLVTNNDRTKMLGKLFFIDHFVDANSSQSPQKVMRNSEQESSIWCRVRN